jgi:hypothetical protein
LFCFVRQICSFWFHTAFLRDTRNGQLLLWKSGLDGPFKDKKHKIFPPNFSGGLACTHHFAASAYTFADSLT